MSADDGWDETTAWKTGNKPLLARVYVSATLPAKFMRGDESAHGTQCDRGAK